MSLCTHLQKGSPSFTMAQAASPRMDHSNTPDWSRYLQCLRPTLVFPVFARTVFTQPSSQLLFLHKSNHRRLLSLVSGTLHNQYCPTQYLFCLPRAHTCPGSGQMLERVLQLRRTPKRTQRSHPVALPGCPPPISHSSPLLQQTSPHGQFRVSTTLVGSTLSRSSCLCPI